MGASHRAKLRVCVSHEYVIEDDIVVEDDCWQELRDFMLEFGEEALLRKLEERSLGVAHHRLEVEYA